LKDASKYIVGPLAGVSFLGFNSCGRARKEKSKGSWPFPYKKLDPEKVRILTHDFCVKNGCGFGGFAGIVNPLGEEIGEPFSMIPLEMMSFAGGGVKGWGTLCGALNGASAAVSLVCDLKASGEIINELLGWYTNELFPSEISNSHAKKVGYSAFKCKKILPQSRSGSPLCHVSVTKWSNASGYALGSPEQDERCARLTGDVVAKAVTLLNDFTERKFFPQFKLSDSSENCLSCHGPENEVSNVASKMDCIQCHGSVHKE